MKTFTKRIIFFFCEIILITLPTFGFAQAIEGYWEGKMDVMGKSLTIGLHIKKTADGYTTKLDSPDQGAKGVKTDETIFADGVLLTVKIGSINGKYVATLSGDELRGSFSQGGFEAPLNLKRIEVAKAAVVPPKHQDPKMPYPYQSEEINFSNDKAGIKLAGTLTLPRLDGKAPAVVLITGSGPQNRDEELLGHRPFLVLSDYLTRKGIIVLRYDDRGVGESEGKFERSTTLDFATDTRAAIAYLKTRKEVQPDKIGVIGHSEGGIIAAIVASETEDVDFVISMAGTGVRGDKLLLRQQSDILKLQGVDKKTLDKVHEINSIIFAQIINSSDDEELKESITKSIIAENQDSTGNVTPEQKAAIEQEVARSTSPWMLGFIRLDPAQYWSKVKQPVLLMNGTLDKQVAVDVNLPAIELALNQAGNKNISVWKGKNLNHLFQQAKTGDVSEYGPNPQTLAPEAMEQIAIWILKTTK